MSEKKELKNENKNQLNESLKKDELESELNKLKIASYDIRAEIQSLNQLLQNVEIRISEVVQALNPQ